jgi:hypothetical protein
MDNKKLLKANDLRSEIIELEKIIDNVKTQDCQWIDFTYGNGSDRKSVCNDEQIIEQVRDILLFKNEEKLVKLLIEFKSL